MSEHTSPQLYRTLRRGSVIPAAAWEGEVISVFSRAANLMSGGGQLVSLVIDELQMTDFSLLLPSLPPLFEGMTVSSSADFLRIRPASRPSSPSAPAFPGADIDLSGAELWSGVLPAFTGAALPEGLPETLRGALLDSSKSEGLLGLASGRENLWSRRARKVLAAAEHGAADSALDLSGLIGLGVGFTPSGDDFIAGACAAEEMLSRLRDRFSGDSQSAPPEIDRRAISGRAAATTYGGTALLRRAAAGSYSALIIELLRLLLCPSAGGDLPGEEAGRLRDRCAEAVRTAETYGETSGIDSLTGMWWYLEQAAAG